MTGEVAAEVEAEDAFEIDNLMHEALTGGGVPERLRRHGRVTRLTYEVIEAERQED